MEVADADNHSSHNKMSFHEMDVETQNGDE
jgi:hypothetical protein